VGTAIAAQVGGLRPVAALLALSSSLFIQIGTNLANDYSDFKRGADAERVGPQRVTQSGLVQPATVKRAAWIAFGIAMLLGLALTLMSGWPLLVIGIVSVASGWLYTGGPWSRPAARSTHRRCRSRRRPGLRAPPWARWPPPSSSSTTCATGSPTPRSARTHWR